MSAAFNQLGEFHAELVLSGTGHLVVVLFGGDPQLAHQQKHLRTNVLSGVVGSNGEVTLFQLNFVGEVATFFKTARVPAGFDGVNAVEGSALTEL